MKNDPNFDRSEDYSEFDRKRMKRSGKATLKRHYVLLVAVCLIISVLGATEFNILSPLTNLLEAPAITENQTVKTIKDKADTILENGNIFNLNIKASNVLNNIMRGNVNDAITDTEEYTSNFNSGVFASIANNVLSGTAFITVFAAILNIVGPNHVNIAVGIFIALVAAFILFIDIFVVNTLIVPAKRIVLESRKYEKVGLGRITFLIKVKKWFNAALNILYKDLFQTLWAFTIVGIPIKRYSYYMVPYIVAENPSISPKQSLKLSIQMMKGHKWECFVFELSYIGWYILDVFTLGLLGIFYLMPYKEASMSAYYAYIRRCAIINNIPNVELLNDRYLFKNASKESLETAYNDIEKLQNELKDIPSPDHTGVYGFFEKNFGIVPTYNAQKEKDYKKYVKNKTLIEQYNECLEGLRYPSRLSPNPESPKRSRLSNLYYLRHYSITSIILLFFIFSFIGWLWEVGMHLVEDGVFVNRGVMHGPWLPIYGGGGVLILVILTRFRKKTLLEFFSAVVLCGFVEYFTAVILEATHNGTKWWDYSGYFLNLNGRICAEGLFVFGLGGLGIVYIVAPLIDNFIRRMKFKVVVSIAIALVCIFLSDTIYSQYHPNMGKGITDYDTTTTQISTSE